MSWHERISSDSVKRSKFWKTSWDLRKCLPNYILRYIKKNLHAISVWMKALIFFLWYLHPLTPMSDQDRISPYNINTISSRLMMRIKKWSTRGLLIDPIPNSLKWNHKKSVENTKENNTHEILGVKGLGCLYSTLNIKTKNCAGTFW